MMTSDRSPTTFQLLVGYLAAITMMLCNMLSASLVQALQGVVPDFQLSAIRSAVQGIIFLIVGRIASTDFKAKDEQIPRLIYSGVSYFLFNVGFCAGVTYLPLGDLQGIVAIAAIGFAVAQSKLLFNMDIPKSVIIAALLCIVGVILTLQPDWLFKKSLSPTIASNITTQFEIVSANVQSDDTSKINELNAINTHVVLGYMFGIMGGAGQGIMVDANGILLHDMKILPKATYAMLGCTVGCIAFMFYFEEPMFAMDITQIMCVVGQAFLYAIVTLTSLYSASVISGPSLCVVYSFEVLTMLLSQYTIMYSIKPGNFNWIEVLGCSIIVIGACIPGMVDICAQKAKADQLP